MKISCIMTTYGRFNCVERSIQYFLNQQYQETELIIFNTDTTYPLILGESLKKFENKIFIINNSIDFITAQDYTSVGAIRRDALTYATGDYYNCWDDDDIFLPNHLQQCVEGLLRTGRKAFKPRESFFRNGNGQIQVVKNVMEASIVVSIKEVGFDLETGKEHLAWYTKLRDEKELNEDEKDTVPAYCFDWISNPLASHKQSGDINNINNFENHKRSSVDRAFRSLEYVDISSYYQPFFDFMKTFS